MEYTWSTYRFDAGDIAETANQMKELTLVSLVEDGLIKEEVAKKWGETHIITTYKPKHWGQWFVDKFFPKKDNETDEKRKEKLDSLYYRMVTVKD